MAPWSRLKTAFGDVFGESRSESKLDEEVRGAALDSFWQDVRFGLRQLRRSPGFTIAAIAALALGIGANTAIFSVVNAVLLKPLTYPDADRMVEFSRCRRLCLPTTFINIPEFHFFQRQTSVFKEVVAYDNAGPGFNLTGGPSGAVHGIHVTEGYFRVYGAPVTLGRTFTPQEDSPHGGKVVVLSYGLWQRRFGGDPRSWEIDLTGQRTLHHRRRDRKGFRRRPQADLWLPFQFDPASTDKPLFSSDRQAPAGRHGGAGQRAIEAATAQSSIVNIRRPDPQAAV